MVCRGRFCFITGNEVCFLCARRKEWDCFFVVDIRLFFFFLFPGDWRLPILTAILFETFLLKPIRFFIRFELTYKGKRVLLSAYVFVLAKTRFLPCFLREKVFSSKTINRVYLIDFTAHTKWEGHVVFTCFLRIDIVASCLFYQASLTYSVLEVFICSHCTRLLDQLWLPKFGDLTRLFFGFVFPLQKHRNPYTIERRDSTLALCT